VDIQGERVAGIGRGLLILLGVYPGDGEAEAVWLARKALDLRIFPDHARPMNRNVVEVGGGLLVVSQFTLAADVSRGNRPGFSRAAGPEVAEPLYERFIAELSARHAPVAAGRFGADMQVSLVNDGPVTILLERGPT
jgi:D-tyrosyl-tRNA(Tyr) deacylase